MRSLYHKLSNTIPIRPRVALVLAIAERVIGALGKNTEAFNAVQKALVDGWRWEQGENVGATQLYDNDDEALALQGCLVKDEQESSAIMAATSAFYYTLWHAYMMDLHRGQVREGEIPGMTDVTEEVIDEVCEHAIHTSLCDSDWIIALANRLSADFPTTNPEELGPVVPRQYFKLAPS
jgi:hypothetical protein